MCTTVYNKNNSPVFIGCLICYGSLDSLRLFPYLFFFLLWRCCPTQAMGSSFLRFIDHTQRRITVARNPLDERSARRRDHYLAKHHSGNRQTSMSPPGFEPTISAGQRPQTYAFNLMVTGIGTSWWLWRQKNPRKFKNRLTRSLKLNIIYPLDATVTVY